MHKVSALSHMKYSAMFLFDNECRDRLDNKVKCNPDEVKHLNASLVCSIHKQLRVQCRASERNHTDAVQLYQAIYIVKLIISNINPAVEINLSSNIEAHVSDNGENISRRAFCLA